ERLDPALVERLHQRLTQITASSPDDHRLKIMLARLTAWAGKPDDARKLLLELATTPDHRVSALMALVDLQVESQQFDEAIGYCRVALESADEQRRPEVLARLMELHLLKGDTAAAESLAGQLAGSSGT